MGRPPKDASGAAEKTLTIRLTAEDRARLDRLVTAAAAQLAGAAGELAGVAGEVTVTSYLRALIRREDRELTARQGTPPPATPPPAKRVAAKPGAAKASQMGPEQVREALRNALDAGRTQREIATSAKVDATRLSRFATGKGNLSPENLSRLAAALR